MRRSLLSVSAVALGLVAAASVPAAAGPIGLLPGPGSVAMVSATSSVSGPGIDRIVFFLNGGSGFSGIWSGGGGASVCIGCFVSASASDFGGGNPFGFGGGNPFTGTGSAGTGNSGGSGAFTGQISLPAIDSILTIPASTVPFQLFGTMNGLNVFGQGELLFSSGAIGGLAAGAPFQSSEAPEPASLLLLSSGASALFLAARRRRKAAAKA